jgi:hypothetical protein
MRAGRVSAFSNASACWNFAGVLRSGAAAIGSLSCRSGRAVGELGAVTIVIAGGVDVTQSGTLAVIADGRASSFAAARHAAMKCCFAMRAPVPALQGAYNSAGPWWPEACQRAPLTAEGVRPGHRHITTCGGSSRRSSARHATTSRELAFPAGCRCEAADDVMLSDQYGCADGACTRALTVSTITRTSVNQQPEPIRQASTETTHLPCRPAVQTCRADLPCRRALRGARARCPAATRGGGVLPLRRGERPTRAARLTTHWQRDRVRVHRVRSHFSSICWRARGGLPRYSSSWRGLRLQTASHAANAFFGLSRRWFACRALRPILMTLGRGARAR